MMATERPNHTNETLSSIVIGAAVGDALGVPYEFKPRGFFTCKGLVGHGTHDQPAGTWSDDTSMMLALCDSIRACDGRVDVADMRQRFWNWFRYGQYTQDGVVFDYGGTTARALRSGQGCDGENDNGNGSLMRTAPLACTDATDDEIRAVSAITHAHPISTEACVRFVHILRDAMESPQAILGYCKEEYEKMPKRRVKSGGYVLDTLGASLWCLAHSDSYAKCVLEAVNLGGDTDTTACVAGALAGAVYGYEGIPTEWVDEIRHIEVIWDCLF